MYSVKPILGRVNDLELPTCMYHVKSTEVYGDSSGNSSERFLSDLSKQVELITRKNDLTVMASLGERQDIILQKLEELQSQIVSMKHSMRMCFKPAQNQKGVEEKTFKPKVKVRDIVINIHPEYLPLSFPLIKKIYGKKLPIKFSFFTHSSVSTLPKAAADFQESLSHGESQENEVKVHIIWKTGSNNAEMILSPIDHVPIYSEVNILRFFSRIGFDSVNYELQTNPNESDKIFDVCFKLFNIQADGERPKIIDLLVSYIEKQNPEKGISFVDLAVYSALTSHKNFIPKNHSQKASKWLKIIENSQPK